MYSPDDALCVLLLNVYQVYPEKSFIYNVPPSTIYHVVFLFPPRFNVDWVTIATRQKYLFFYLRSADIRVKKNWKG